MVRASPKYLLPTLCPWQRMSSLKHLSLCQGTKTTLGSPAMEVPALGVCCRTSMVRKQLSQRIMVRIRVGNPSVFPSHSVKQLGYMGF